MKRAAGVILTAPDGSHLFLRRTGKNVDHPHKWAFPGGHIEEGETAEDAARRELKEEAGYVPLSTVHFTEHSRRISDGVDFTTFHARVDEKFEPKLNHEHDAHEWMHEEAALNKLNLHPGARTSLNKFSANELGVARMMKAGELVSPQEFGNMLLVKMRITGTGASYRPTVDEFVWRDSKLYLNKEFVDRCQGLPVIWEHPEGGQPMNSESFSERIVGTIFEPYIDGDEVWGIAKIYDDKAKEILKSDTTSTSPCVVFRPQEMGKKFRTDDGTPLLVEGKPWILDHLAICEVGVWDKGGAPSGVANDVKADSVATTPEEGMTMAEKIADKAAEKTAEQPVVKADSELAGSKEGEKIDRILAHLDALHARHDAMETGSSEMAAKFDALCKRMDALEIKEKPEGGGEKPPAAEHQHKEEGHEDANLKAEAEPTPLAADGEEQPGTESEMKALEVERGENHLKAHDSAADSAKLRARLDEIEKHVNMPEDVRTQFVAAQSKAERVHQAFGDAAGAPRWTQGEKIDQYRRRLLSAFKKHSKAWAEVDLAPFVGKALDVVEDQVYADSITAAKNPTDIGPGMLRESVTVDATGRRISRFYGDPEACWGPFKQPLRRIERFNTKFN